MNKKVPAAILALLFLAPLASCQQYVEGTILFDLDGGHFVDPSFKTTKLTGQGGTRVQVDIPDAAKDGYYFVGWREKDSNGNYREISTMIDDETGESYYPYPYGTDTFYAYFEPLENIKFDLTDATDRSGELIAPLIDNDKSFDGETLAGYANKDIPSLDYLPTASGDNLYFKEWYIEYPLVEREDENHQTHLYLNTSAEKGYYPFKATLFPDGDMVFPLLENGQELVLKAAWEEYPKVTVHFNLEGIPDYSFQVPRNALIANELKDMMKEVLNLDITADASQYLLERQGETYRFDGFFLDEDFTEQFGLNNSLSTSDEDLYLKWSKEIQVTFDYNGGTLDGESQKVISAFAGDRLADEYQKLKPTKENADFVGFTLNGESFDIRYDNLPDEDTTLVASYDDYPELSIVYNYPSDYEGEKVPDDKIIQAPESDITASIEEAKNKNFGDSLEVGQCYYLDGDTEVNFVSSTMPHDDMTIYIDVLYKPVINVVTLYGSDSSYQESSNIGSTYLSTCFDDEGERRSESLNYDSRFSVADGSDFILNDELTIDGTTYLFDGVYSDEGLTYKVDLPYSLEVNKEGKNEVTLYRKMTEAVTLTFYELAENDELVPLNKELLILPNKYVLDYQDELTALLGEYDHLEISVGDSYQVVSTFLPSVDSDIIVVR